MPETPKNTASPTAVAITMTPQDTRALIGELEALTANASTTTTTRTRLLLADLLAILEEGSPVEPVEVASRIEYAVRAVPNGYIWEQPEGRNEDRAWVQRSLEFIAGRPEDEKGLEIVERDITDWRASAQR